MDNYLVDRETLGKLVDILLSRRYPDRPANTLGEIRERGISRLDDKISKDLFGILTKSQLDELNNLLDDQNADPTVFEKYFKNIGINLTQQVNRSMQSFAIEFLGGQSA